LKSVFQNDQKQYHHSNILMLKIITHRSIWLNILFGIILAVGIFAIFLLSLKWITGHGKSATVPSVTGKKITEAEGMLEKAGFSLEIQDSVYVDTLPPMSIIRQFPEADEVVKRNRTVYLVINRSQPPVIEMPNLVGYSFRNAQMVLKNMDLRIGDTTFKPDFARNAVLEQIYKGQKIAPGTKISKGSVISLVLGDGIGKQEFAVPVITGMRFGEAKRILESNGIIIGAVMISGNVTDTLSAWIYRQVPERFDDEKRIQRIRAGQTIDVFLQADKPVADTTEPLLPLPE
jgi:hypothetical protein